MYAKLQELREEREEGFTLIELLVVVTIIGILSAIAVPAFLNQRKSAVDATVASDVSNAAKQVETWITKQGATPKNFDGTPAEQGVVGPRISLDYTGATTAAAVDLRDIKASKGTSMHITGNSANYCIIGLNEGGDLSTTGVVYASNSGGLNKSEAACAGGVIQPSGSASGNTSQVPAVASKTASGNLTDYSGYDAATGEYPASGESWSGKYSTRMEDDPDAGVVHKVIDYEFTFTSNMSGTVNGYWITPEGGIPFGFTVANGKSIGSFYVPEEYNNLELMFDGGTSEFYSSDNDMKVYGMGA